MDVFTRLACQVGFDSVYILVDKIDETDSTGRDSQKAARLVAPMLTNIKLLELDHCAFKFFLWDNVRAHFGDELRSDRITMSKTEWTNEDLQKMLEKRILAYSLGRTEFNSLFDKEINYDMLNLIIHFSFKSPRDINRLLTSIFAEAAADATDNNVKISWASVERGINKFSSFRKEELYGSDIVNRIERLKNTVFTVSDVASIFRIRNAEEDISSQTATNRARNLVEKWKKAGLITQIEPTTVVSNGRRRSANQYQINDPRVNYFVNPNEVLKPFEII